MNLNAFWLELRLNRALAFWLGLGLLVFEFLLVVLVTAAELEESLSGLFQMIPKSIRALMGATYVDLLTPKGFLAFAFTHPVALLLICSGAVGFSSRSSIGRPGAGLTDMLAAQPLPRYLMIALRAAAGEVLGLFMILGMWAGHYLGVKVSGMTDPPASLPFLYVAMNAYAFFLAVQGLGFLTAVLSRRRASAVGISIGVLAFMLFLIVAAELWQPFSIPAHLSFLNFYKPGKTVSLENFPWLDVLVLLGYYLSFLVAAMAIFHKRDL
jgi:ABC-type transport system involved in multi-copper enzyme maturation permease subunit